MRNNTKKIVYSALFAAIAIVLTYFIHFPIFSFAPFLEYNAGDIPLVLSAVVLGPGAGLAVTLVACVLQGLTVSAQNGVVGIMMHFFATGSYVLCAGLIARKKTPLRVVQALICGAITQILIMIPLNLMFAPALYMKSDLAQDVAAVGKCFLSVPQNALAAVCGAVFAGTFIVAFALTLVYTVEGTDGKKNRLSSAGLKGTVCGIVCGLIYGALALFVMNLIFSDIAFSEAATIVNKMIFTTFVPFNSIKAVSNAIVAYLLYATVGKRIKLDTTKNAKKK